MEIMAMVLAPDEAGCRPIRALAAWMLTGRGC
jgi:hypothetical protein